MSDEESDGGNAMEERKSEWTWGVVVLGMALSVGFAFSSLYLGLWTGNTISASIPAAVISAIILRQSSVLHHNMVQTMASAGESLAAGVLFTMPALVISGAMTDDLPWYLVSGVALLGGVGGIIAMIRIRGPLIVERDKELVFPEGRACARMLQFFKEKSSGIGTLVKFTAIGVAMKLLNGVVGIVPEEAGLYKYKKMLASGKETVVFSVDSYISVAIVAVGVVIGFNAAMLVLIGGLTSALAQPIYANFSPNFNEATNLTRVVRFMGIGCMVVAAFASLLSIGWALLKPKSAKAGTTTAGQQVAGSQEDMKWWHQVVIGLVCIVGVFLLYQSVSGSTTLSLTSTVAVAIASGFFALVASYTVGQIGSTSNPVSGMTISGLLFACVVLYLFKDQLIADPKQAKVILLVIAGVVCCAACTAGAVSQDLKTGYLLNATPKHQQWAMILGTIISALVLPLLLSLLQRTYGFGDKTPEHQNPMPAPQAGVMGQIVETFLTWLKGGELPYGGMILIGMGIGLVLVAGDMYLKALQRQGRKVFRLYPMAAAVGIYLGLSLSMPIIIGGLVALYISRKVGPRVNELPKKPEDDDERSLAMTPRRMYETLVETHYIMPAAGLIFGEAATGIILALALVGGAQLPIIGGLIPIGEQNQEMFSSVFSWLSFAAIIMVAVNLLNYVRHSAGESLFKIKSEDRQRKF